MDGGMDSHAEEEKGVTQEKMAVFGLKHEVNIFDKP